MKRTPKFVRQFDRRFTTLPLEEIPEIGDPRLWWARWLINEVLRELEK